MKHIIYRGVLILSIALWPFACLYAVGLLKLNLSSTAPCRQSVNFDLDMFCGHVFPDAFDVIAIVFLVLSAILLVYLLQKMIRKIVTREK